MLHFRLRFKESSNSLIGRKGNSLRTADILSQAVAQVARGNATGADALLSRCSVENGGIHVLLGDTSPKTWPSQGSTIRTPGIVSNESVDFPLILFWSMDSSYLDDPGCAERSWPHNWDLRPASDIARLVEEVHLDLRTFDVIIRLCNRQGTAEAEIVGPLSVFSDA